MSEIFTGNSDNHIELINNLRKLLSEDISIILTNHDILRFLRARNGSIQRAHEMILKWFEWRHTLLDPLPPHNLRLSPNVILASPITLDQHPSKSLLPVTHEGFSKFGHPIYWEKTGYIQSTFPEVKKQFTNVELLQYHIMSNELVECRLLYATKKFGHQVDKMIVVFDMSHVQVTLDMDSIWYIKQILQVDQNYYPERLYKLYIINSPWYFPALYGMFKPFIDARTRDKINIFSTDFLPSMLEVIDKSEIPTEYGGEKIVRWDMMWEDETGASRKQAEEFFYERISKTYKNRLSLEEVLVLKQGLVMSGRITQAIEVIDELVQIAEAEGRMTEIPQLKDEIKRLKLQQQNSNSITSSTSTTTTANPTLTTITTLNTNTNSNSTTNNNTSRINNNLLEHNVVDDEIVSLSSTPTVSTVQMSHLSDILSIQIDDVEKHSNYFTYVITVHCRRNESWKIHRRYSQFYKFRKFISRINPRIRSIPFPPKKYFFYNSISVVRYRQRILQDFFNQILKSCEGFDTPEQDIIFRFIEGNDHVANPIRDTLSVGVWTDASNHLTSSLPRYNDINLLNNNNSKNNQLLLANKNNPNNRPLSLSVYDQRIWSTPIAAAVLSCCLLVISIMSQIHSSEHIPLD